MKELICKKIPKHTDLLIGGKYNYQEYNTRIDKVGPYFFRKEDISKYFYTQKELMKKIRKNKIKKLNEI